MAFPLPRVGGGFRSQAAGARSLARAGLCTWARLCPLQGSLAGAEPGLIAVSGLP